MTKHVAIALLTLPILACGQKETEVTATIKSITVYTSAAEVNYEKEMILSKGKSTIVFTDLTPFIEENSINVSVSDVKVDIVTVAERINYAKEKYANNNRNINFSDSIKKLNKELGLISIKTDVLGTEKNMLFKGEAIGGLSHGVAVAEIEKASAFFNKRYGELAKELYYLNEREEIIREKISNYERDMKETNTVTIKTMSEIKVTVNCPVEEKVKFKFRFLTRKAGWAPVYDFKYEGATKPLQFIFRANVFNASGTEWTDVNMKLSTADPIGGFSLPTIDPGETKTKKRSNDEESVKFKQMEVTNAITEYKISHEYSIPSDSKPYSIDVNTQSIPANYNYLLIPKVDPFGFLMAKIPNWNNYNLIPGSTNIYCNGTYMGKTFLDTYSDNDTLSLYLGKDKNIQCTRTEKSIDHKNFFIGNFSIEETSTEISVKNNSTEGLAIEIIDQVPVIEKDDVEKLSLEAESKLNYDKTDGSIKWKNFIKPGESLAVKFNYEIKTPKELYDAFKPTKKKFRTVSCPAF